MDERIRGLERLARQGDIDAAFKWLHEADRVGDYAAQYEALMLICELQHPGLMEQLRQVEEVTRLTQWPFTTTHMETRRTSVLARKTVTVA